MMKMLKNEFLNKLRAKLSGVPERELEERLGFYCEMIDDKIEDGCTEEEAVSGIGSADEIAEQIIADIPFSAIAKERIKPKRSLGATEIVLLALGSPIWLSLLVAALAIALSLYAVIWSVAVSVWAVFVSVSASAVGGAIAGSAYIFTGNAPAGIATLGAALVLSGLAVLLFFGCYAATKSVIRISKKTALGIKKCFIRRRNDNDTNN